VTVREIVFDTETTGLDPLTGDRITEIGCVEVIDFLPTGKSFHTYVNPQREVPKEVVEITGLTTEFLADKPLFGDVVDAFLEFVGDSRVVAHNASFDRKFVNAELEWARRPTLGDERFFDTLELARTMFPGSYNSLDALCKRFEISLETRDKHGALIDARLLAEVYLELNGGRARRLDLSAAAPSNGAAGGDAAGGTARRARPEPLPELVTEEDRKAHAAFVETLGEESLWRKLGLSEG
jgi:DNA polymerase-3 subunit epsilon